MIRKTALLLLLCGLALAPVPGTTVAQQRQGHVEFKVVWEKEFDKEIKDVVFGETDDGSLYPKVIVFDYEVRYYDTDGSELWTLPYVRGFPPAVSRTGRYVGMVRSLSEAEEERGSREAVWGLYDDMGREITTVSYVWAYEASSRHFFISEEDGAFLEADAGSQKLVFRSSDGDVAREVDLFEADRWGGPNSLICAFSEDGEYLAALREELPPGSRGEVDRSTHLVLLHREGAELWRRALGGWMAISVSLSSRARFVAANSWVPSGPMRAPVRMEVKLFNVEGELVGTYAARSQEFSRDENYMALAGENDVSLLTTLTGELLWTVKLPYETGPRGREWRLVTDVDLTSDASIVVIVSTACEWTDNDFRRFRPIVVLFGRDGTVLARQELVGTSGEGGPKVTIGSNGEQVCVTGDTWIIGLDLDGG
jgi:hypothetical protein